MDAKSDDQIAQMISQTYADPLLHVMISYPWDDPTSGIQLVEMEPEYQKRFNCKFGPDKWACEFLDDVGRQVRKNAFDGITAVPPIRFSTVSGHGIGKSVLVAWIIRWIMDTRPYSKGTITANTDTQLRTKTWAELGKWHRLGLTNHWFEYQSSRGNMSYRSRRKDEKGQPLANEWFCSAQTCREENAEAFAGQHAANATSFYIFDEASGIPDKIYATREGGLTDGEPMIFDFGNGTKNSGSFFENCVGKMKHRYSVRSIDSRTVKVTNKNLHAEWIQDHGIDSDFVKVRILGQFPASGSAQFMNADTVREAMKRAAAPNRHANLVIGIDVARFGDDDTVIYPRIGDDARSFGYVRLHAQDTVAITAAVVDMIRSFQKLGMKVSAIFVDATGGSIGGAVGDQLRALRWPAIDVQFGTSSTDKRYRYNADHMWGKLRDAMPRLSLPAGGTRLGDDLFDQLTQRYFGYMVGSQKIWLEPKSEMKDRGIGSPDIADALALTFAQDVATIADTGMMGHNGGPQMQAISEYDPLQTTW